MRTMNKQIIAEAKEFAARWGFLTRDLFFEFICRQSHSQQYRYWNYLVEHGFFNKSETTPQILFLTKKGRSEFGSYTRPARYRFYIDHDAIVARFFLTLSKRGLIGKSWLEYELTRNPIDAYTVLGADRMHRIPDLVFDLKTVDDGIVRCALEIEKTTKSQARYSKIALAYSGFSRISLIIFGSGQDVTEKTIRNSFEKTNLTPGLFQFKDFDPECLQSKIRFKDKEFSVQKLIEIVTNRTVPTLSRIREQNENRKSFRKSDFGEAA